MSMIAFIFLSFLFRAANALYEATFVVKDFPVNMDGYPVLGMVMLPEASMIPTVVDGNGVRGNNTYGNYPEKVVPGPEIRVKRGERVKIKIINHAHALSVSIHWHGIHQNGYQWMDGVPMLTQCGIEEGQSFIYDFVADQPAGTHFYHSHSAAQYGAGLCGPFIIEEPELAQDTVYKQFPYEEDHVVFLMDWNHQAWSDYEAKYAAPIGLQGTKPDYPLWPAQVLTIGGRGQFSCGVPRWNGTQMVTKFVDHNDCDIVNKFGWMYYQTGVYVNEKGQVAEPHYLDGTLGGAGQCQPIPEPYLGNCEVYDVDQATRYTCPAGKSIRMRLINSAAGLPMMVWIDRHTKLTVVAKDGLDVKPVEVPFILIAVGARIDVIVKCDQDPNKDYKLYASFSDAWYPGGSRKLPNNWNTKYFSKATPSGPVHSFAILQYKKKNPIATPENSVYDMAVRYRHIKDVSKVGDSSTYLPTFFDRMPTTKTAPAAVKRFQVNMKNHGNYPGWWRGACTNAPNKPGDPCSYTGMNFEWYVMNNKTSHDPGHAYDAESPILLNNYLDEESHVMGSSLSLDLEYDAENPNTYEIVIVNYEPQNHPMHFHGYHLYQVGYGYWTTDTTANGWKWSTVVQQTKDGWFKKHFDKDNNFVYVPSNHGLPELSDTVPNAPMGDSFTVPPRGFVVLRIVADNPGAWYVHCHMEMHLGSGMGLILKVADKNGKMALPEPPATYPVCGKQAQFKFAVASKTKETDSKTTPKPTEPAVKSGTTTNQDDIVNAKTEELAEMNGYLQTSVGIGVGAFLVGAVLFFGIGCLLGRKLGRQSAMQEQMQAPKEDGSKIVPT